MASTDAKPFPTKNTAYRVTFPILDADGDLVPSATGLDSEVSKEGSTFIDCTNEAIEIATSSGMYYLDLTADEMNADTVAIIVKTSTMDAKTTSIVLYPVENTDIPVNVKGIDAAVSTALVDDIWDELLTGATHNISSSAGRRIRQIGSLHITDGIAQAGTAYSITLADDESSSNHIFNRNLLVLLAGTGAGQTRTIVDYNGTSKVIVVDRDWWIIPDDTSEYSIIADDTPLVVDHGIAQDGGDTTITIRNSASSIDNTYVGGIITILAGTGAGQARLINSYNGNTKAVTICTEWETNPNSTSVYVIMPYGASRIGCISDESLTQLTNGIWNELQSEHTDAGTYGKYIDVAISSVDCIIGQGALSCMWTQKDEGGVPMDNVNTWITLDINGANVIAGTLVTNSSGEVTFMLDAGTYYVWREKAGYDFINPQTWSVS